MFNIGTNPHIAMRYWISQARKIRPNSLFATRNHPLTTEEFDLIMERQKKYIKITLTKIPPQTGEAT